PSQRAPTSIPSLLVSPTRSPPPPPPSPTRRSSDLAGEALCVLTLFRDQPAMWDAWDVDRHVLEMPEPLTTDEQIAASSTEDGSRSEEHTSELQSRFDLVCRLLLEKKKNKI